MPSSRVMSMYTLSAGTATENSAASLLNIRTNRPGNNMTSDHRTAVKVKDERRNKVNVFLTRSNCPAP